MINQSELTLVSDLRRLVAYHHSMGIVDYPLEAAGLLQKRQPVGMAVAVPRPAPEGGGSVGVSSDALGGVSSEVAGGETLAGIAEEIGRCQACELHQLRQRVVPGNGGARGRLMVVGGWASPAAVGESHIFGVEEDRMLALMMKAIQLTPEDVFVTNILKCGLPETVQPTAAHLHCCLAFLQRQIRVVAPEVICAMGTIPVRALLNLSQPLSRLRGRFYPYPNPGGRQIPVMPTYHPSYLLRAPDMKQKTWEDLQRIQKQLAG